MTNEDGSFDYSNMGRRPPLFVETCALRIMTAAGIDMHALREMLLSLAGGRFAVGDIPTGASDARRVFKGALPDMTGHRTMGQASDEIVFARVMMGEGLEYLCRGDRENGCTVHLFVEGQDIPETVVQGMKDLTLDSILRHKWLTEIGLKVVEASKIEQGLMLQLEPQWSEL